MSEEWSFEKDDFLTTTPYEALYAYHKEPFTHAAKMEELAAYSVSKGFKGFKTMYKKYVESLKAQSGTIYIDNVTTSRTSRWSSMPATGRQMTAAFLRRTAITMRLPVRIRSCRWNGW